MCYLISAHLSQKNPHKTDGRRGYADVVLCKGSYGWLRRNMLNMVFWPLNCTYIGLSKIMKTLAFLSKRHSTKQILHQILCSVTISVLRVRGFISWPPYLFLHWQVGSLDGLYTLRDIRGRPDRATFEKRLATAAGVSILTVLLNKHCRIKNSITC